MATLTTSLNTAFTPAASDFVVQATGGVVALERRNTSGAAWVEVGRFTGDMAPIVSNPVAGVQYRFVSITGSPSVQADQ